MRLILLSILFFQWNVLLAQPVAWQANAFMGDILPHSEDIRNLSYSTPFGASLGVLWQNARGGRSIEHPLPARKGIRMQWVSFNNAAQLGRSYSLAAFTEPLFGSNRNLFLSTPIEGGLTYLSKVYDPNSNPENLFFSFPVSFFLSAGLQINYKVKGPWLVNGGLQYQHISNGGIKMPNKGMNFLTFNLGLSYYMRQASWLKGNPKFREYTLPRYLIEGYLYGTAKTLSQNKQLIPMAGFMVNVIKPLNPFHQLVLGTEGLYNEYKKEYYLSQGQSVNAWDQGLLGGYALNIGKTSFRILMGAQLMNTPPEEKQFYQRYVLVQTINKKWLIAGSLKANRHVADIFDIRLGYRITR